MKMTKFAPLMFLLQVALIPRNISAIPTPTPSPDCMGATQGTMFTAQYMKDGTELLAKVMALLEETRPNYSQFDKSVKELETQIAKLPEALAKLRPEILEGLYIAQDRLVRMRKLLSAVANELKQDCEDMIESYDKYPTNEALFKCTKPVDYEFLKYKADQFKKRAVLVEGILDKALELYIEIQNQFSKTKGHLVSFNAILNEDTKKIELKQRGALAAQQDITAQVEQSPTTIILSFGSFRIIIDIGKVGNIAQTKLDTYIKDLKKQLEVIEASQEAATTLIGHVDTIKAYLRKEIELIDDWKINLQSSHSDHINFSKLDLKFGIANIKKNLNRLIEACDKYLNHEIPNIICTGNC